MINLKNLIWYDFKKVANVFSFGTVDTCRLYTDAGDDRLSIISLSKSLIDLGTGNDSLQVQSFANSTINGGAGSDTLTLPGYEQNQLDFVYNGGSQWSLYLASNYDLGAVVQNIETINFKNGISAKLTAAGNANPSITFTGTARGENFWLPLNPASPGIKAASTVINAGAGNDVIYVPMSGGTTPGNNKVNGGTGTDTLHFYGLPQVYSFGLILDGFVVFGFNGETLIETTSIERAEFGEGTKIEFRATGIELTGGTLSLNVTGTEGDDIFHGTAMADSFRTTSGADIYDLRKGGRDTIYFDPMAYAWGTTSEMTVQGFSRDDTIRFLPGMPGAILTDYTKYVDGIRQGDLLISWGSGLTTTTISFTA